jgi:hypothetical protein
MTATNPKSEPAPLPTPMALVALIRGADDSAQGERLLRMWLLQHDVEQTQQVLAAINVPDNALLTADNYDAKMRHAREVLARDRERKRRYGLLP